MTTATQSSAHPEVAADAVLAQLLGLKADFGLPDCVRIEANSRIGFVTVDLDCLEHLHAWCAALGHRDEPTRYPYPQEGLVRYNARWADMCSGWKFDLNCRLQLPISVPCTDDFLDALEIVGGV